MAIIIKTGNAIVLLTIIKTTIKDNKIPTWACDDQGDFTSLARPYLYQAWFKPRISGDELRFGIVGRNDKVLSAKNYAYYHAAFIEMLLINFDEDFQSVSATAQFEEPDIYDQF